MTVRDALKMASSRIDRHDADILLAFVLKRDRAWLVAHDDIHLASLMLRRFEALVRRREKHEPVAHLIREREFHARPFFVSKYVLIPRPETELLVERALARVHDRTAVWDVGTGSGAIAVTLASERPGLRILATDVSSRALTTARQNAKRHHAQNRITFLKSNLLQPSAYRWLKRQARSHDRLIIAANLPYLPSSDRKKLAPDVTKYEPGLALYSGTDGLTLIRRFLRQLSRHLPEWNYRETTILVEFDPPQARELKQLAKKLFPDTALSIHIHRDLAGRLRLLEISIRAA